MQDTGEIYTKTYYNNKEVINKLWSAMVSEARSDVSLFAGDVSWIDRDEAVIRNQTEQGKKISVICRRPLHKDIGATLRLREHVKRLILAGADVKYYPEAIRQEPKIRGLFVDRHIHSTGLLVRKAPRSIISSLPKDNQQHVRDMNLIDPKYEGIARAEGVPGSEQLYSYSGIHYIPPKDVDDIVLLRELFDKLWNNALKAFLLDRLELTLADYVRLLRTVPHYSNLTEDDVSVEKIYTRDLWAVCRLVKNYKFPVTEALIDAYLTQNLDIFQACIALSPGDDGKTILLPPILERHGNKMVIIDGMHRLYYGTFHAKLSQATCLVVSPQWDLPAEPILLDEVIVRPEKPLDKRYSFVNFRPNLFRQISDLEKVLVENARNFDHKAKELQTSQPNITMHTKANLSLLSSTNYDGTPVGATINKNSVPPIRILFLAANPKDSSHLRLYEEIKRIDQAIRQAEFRNKFDISQQWAVRVAELQGHLLRYRPNIVHFSGHGNAANQILLEDNLGNMKPVSAQALSQLFAVLKDDIQCVMLNMCYSDEQAKAIAEHIEYVIGMSSAISDEAAISFSTSFYQALGYGRTIKTAFDLGISQLDLENWNEQTIPKLLVRSN